MSRLVVMLVSGFLLCGLAHAEAIPWSEVGSRERAVLGLDEAQWESLPEERQKRLLRGAKRWQELTPEQRRRVRQNLQRWKQLSPEEREWLRERYRAFRRLPPEKRAELRRLRRWFRSLPPERRQRILRRWRASGDPDAALQRRLDRMQRHVVPGRGSDAQRDQKSREKVSE
ncbi:MAG: DUF3106 domain-containing protein [Gammaproteobacteria bacterium]|nr:MAG: DUF3106 domain-containing protein [Gammaproteobacteria bacterium]